MSSYTPGVTEARPADPAPTRAPLLGADPPVRRVGLLGGTFDPPHVAHVVAAAWVRAALGLDEVRLVVAHRPWQKVGDRQITAAPDRLALVEAAVAPVPGLRASDVELRRGGDSFTIDTLTELAAAEPEVAWFVIVGADAAAGLATWHRWRELPARATFVVVTRGGEAPHPDPPEEFRIVRVPIPRLEVSSTELRGRLAAGLPIDGLVAPAVSSAIAERGLYRGTSV